MVIFSEKERTMDSVGIWKTRIPFLRCMFFSRSAAFWSISTIRFIYLWNEKNLYFAENAETTRTGHGSLVGSGGTNATTSEKSSQDKL